MKKFTLPVLIVFVMLIACNPHHDPKPGKSVQDKLLGKWKLLRSEDYTYYPVDVLLDYDEYIGEADDSVVFRNDHMLYSYSTQGDDQYAYEVINDSTIDIDDDLYKIRKLTDTELYLYYEESDPGINGKYIGKIYLYR